MNELKLSKEIYNYSLVKTAAKEFADISNILVSNEENYVKCIFSKCVYDDEITLKEFENYVIDLSNQRGLVWQ